MPRTASRFAAVAVAGLLCGAAHAGCDAASGARTAALVELYTSEGCSSCPPADRRLGRLAETLDAGAVAVPVALHVSYWDGLGWKDPYAQPVFVERQRELVRQAGGTTVYTPQFFVGGREAAAWPADLAAGVRRINAQPPAADIRLRAAPTAAGALAVAAEAVSRSAGDDAALYVALTEDGLVSRVLRGENGGRALGHDGVARVWIGPVALRSGRAAVERDVALPAGANRPRLALVAFVQDRASGRVLQALKAASCAQP